MPITERYILMCDDVRREDNGKFLLIGLYTPGIVTAQIPVVLPTLTFFCELECSRPGTFRLTFRLRHEEGNQTLVEGMAPVNVADPTQPVIMPVKMGPIQINSPGGYTFSLEFESQPPIVHSFPVQLNPLGLGTGGPPQVRR